MKNHIKNFFGKILKHKWIMIILLLLIIGLCAFLFLKSKLPGKGDMSEVKKQTTSIMKKDLVNSISLTGEIASTEKKEITTDLKDATVKDVRVSVGDYVNAGDTIVVFDSEDYEDNVETVEDDNALSKLKQNQSLNQAKENIDNANDTYAREKEEGDSSVAEALGDYTSAQEKEQEAKNNYENALKDTEKKKEAYQDIKENKSSLKKEMEKQNKAEQEAKVEYEQAKSTFEKAEAEIKYAKESDEGYDALYQTYVTAQEAYVSADKKYQDAQKNAERAKSQYESIDQAKQAYEQAKQAEEEALEKYKEASNSTEKSGNNYKKTVNNVNATNEKNADNIKDSQESYAITSKEVSNNSKSQAKQLQSAKEELEGCVVTTPISGYITEINVAVDDKYNSGETLFVVQDLSGFMVEATVDEGDIPKIEKGQKAVIKTDATEDEELEGEVTYVALTPESSSQSGAMSSSSSSSASYKIEITLAETNDKLRVGMTAKTSIVLEEAKDVYCVPYDCVDEAKDGTSTITVVENDTERKITVTTGMETDYYVEIQSNELNENMKVLTKTVKTSSDTSSFDAMMPMGGGFDGSGFGDAPSGGFSGGPSGGFSGGPGER